MDNMPADIQLLAQDLVGRNAAMAILELDSHGLLLSCSGDLQIFGLSGLGKHCQLSDYGLPIEELLPQFDQPFKIIDLEVTPGIYATVYLQSYLQGAEQKHWVFLLDRTDAAEKDLALRQAVNTSILKRQ